MAKSPLGTPVLTGEKCPESGNWEAQSIPSAIIPLTKGETFPPYNNQSIIWKLVEYI
ncbi:hypothetical protein Q4Q35_07595 [Flavivirga aquimarina]|uniref:Uncharacterized protein n=1 Tax=Flavivirga aquimarina TaxID=2027862 RepID=A0ABT8W9C9_9FLAO|nr:hypothetical protein [Flavivirga aquimarina]MDO5969667.1 hypothetical protein [Flavivirga aquimarina]